MVKMVMADATLQATAKLVKATMDDPHQEHG
jgi:hypothetical protein